MIVYGANCNWRDDIKKASKLDNGLPCCPICKSVLFQIDDDDWFNSASKYAEENEDDEYLAFLNWNRGKHFKSYRAARSQYNFEEINPLKGTSK